MWTSAWRTNLPFLSHKKDHFRLIIIHCCSQVACVFVLFSRRGVSICSKKCWALCVCVVIYPPAFHSHALSAFSQAHSDSQSSARRMPVVITGPPLGLTLAEVPPPRPADLSTSLICFMSPEPPPPSTSLLPCWNFTLKFLLLHPTDPDESERMKYRLWTGIFCACRSCLEHILHRGTLWGASSSPNALSESSHKLCVECNVCCVILDTNTWSFVQWKTIGALCVISSLVFRGRCWSSAHVLVCVYAYYVLDLCVFLCVCPSVRSPSLRLLPSVPLIPECVSNGRSRCSALLDSAPRESSSVCVCVSVGMSFSHGGFRSSEWGAVQDLTLQKGREGKAAPGWRYPPLAACS